jgi:outer membrane protein assembly factor BamB
MVLPDLLDGGGLVRHLAVGAGKDRQIYVVDRDAMGKWNASMNLMYQQVSALRGQVFSEPAYFDHTVYFGAVDDAIKAFTILNARFVTVPASRTAGTYGYPGSTPSISANGSLNAILWAVENTNPAVLHAYDARNLSHELYNSSQAPSGRDAFGAGNKFITPTIANGHVYVGTTNGVAVFGIIKAPSAPLNLRIVGR